jgi:hypothetical protein
MLLETRRKRLPYVFVFFHEQLATGYQYKNT